MHWNLFVLGIAETLACLISAPIKLNHTRKKSFSFAIALMTFGCLLLVFVPNPANCVTNDDTCVHGYVTLLLSMLVKFGITIYSSILITYTSEVYPTEVRSLGYGFNMTIGRFGNIMMPLSLIHI
eukprot:TRINITY_DN13416_c0_g1_i2.p2 TRINITY_DN13416_c0_g1~~TRINITY_DN13416_c0_g1_i2.p2  ORF type:complete len:125 (-),score=15.72 TRINITY_DN13416_c0_g1_i2:59-433(-)